MAHKQQSKSQTSAEETKQNSSKTPMRQILAAQTGTTAKEEDFIKDYNIERDPIPGTPLWVTGSKEKGYMLTIMNYTLCTPYKTKAEVIDHLNKNLWNVITQLILTLIEHVKRNPVTNNKN